MPDSRSLADTFALVSGSFIGLCVVIRADSDARPASLIGPGLVRSADTLRHAAEQIARPVLRQYAHFDGGSVNTVPHIEHGATMGGLHFPTSDLQGTENGAATGCGSPVDHPLYPHYLAGRRGLPGALPG